MEFNHFFEKLSQYDYIYPSEEADPRRKFLTTQGAMLGGAAGYVAKDKIREILTKDALTTSLSHVFGTPSMVRKAKMKTIYHPRVIEKLLKHHGAASTLGGAVGGALALRTLYNLSE
jgi:hypothetical protein